MSKSKKNNKKTAKKVSRNSYKIESLEPRLLMDATLADDWIKEADSSVNQFGDYNISASGSKMEGLLVYEQGTSSEPEALALADVISGQKIQYKQDVKDVKDYVCETVEALRDEGTKTQKEDAANKHLSMIIAKTILNNADPDDENYANLVKAANEAEAEYNAAEAAYQKARKEFTVDADTLVQELTNGKNRRSEWTFAVDTTNSSHHKVSVQIKKNASLTSSTNKKVAADISEQTKIGVLFDTHDLNSNASGYTTVSFTLDGDKNTGFDDNASVDVRFDFKQDLTQGNTDANIGILGLESRNDGGAVSLPDLTVIGSFRTDSKNNSTIATNYEYDLDFRVKDYASIAPQLTNFTVDDTDHLKYIGNTAVGQTPVWQDAAGSAVNDENALIPDFANVRIGDVLKQFNAIAKWLQNAETEILKNDFEGIIDQNASSFLYLSNYFATFVKTPPQSFQELLSRFNNSVITAEFKNVSGKNICQLKYDGWITSQNLEASVSEALFKSLSNSFGGIEKVSLSLGAQSNLKMTFDIPMDELGSVGNSAKLKSIGVDAEKVAGLVGAKNVCVADKALNKTSTVGEEVTFALLEDGVKKGDITISSSTSLDEAGIQSIVGELNKAYSATGAVTSPKFGVIINKDGNGDVDKFAIVTDDTTKAFSLSFATDNSRKMCINGAQQFCSAFLIDTTTVTEVTIDSAIVKPKEAGVRFDWAAAINEVLMSNSDYTDYSAVTLGDVVIIFYSQSEQNVLVMGENPTSVPTDIWLNFNGGVEKQILLSSSHPVETSNSDLSFAFAINGGAAKNILLEAETLANCYTVDDVVSVINGELTKLGNGIKAFAWEGKIGFLNESDLPFGVSLSNKDLGFDNLAYSSTTNCMKMKFDVGGPADIEVDIDLYNFFTTKSDPTIGDLLDEIKTQCNNILSTKAPSCSVDVNGMSLVVSGGKFSSSGAVVNLNGCSLVELLGWNVDNDSDSFLVVHAQSQKEITISSFSLDIYETLTSNGNIASARLGMVGVDVTGNVGIQATRTLTAKKTINDITAIPLDDADADFVSNFTLGGWSYASTSTNTLSVDLSNGLLVDDATQAPVKQHVMSVDLYATVVARALTSNANYVSKVGSSFAASLDQLNMSALVEKVTKALKENVLKSILAYGESATPSTDPILAVLNQKLPLFGKSAPELLGLINKLNDVIDNISKSHPATLQELNQRIDKALGAKLYFTFHASSIDFSFVWGQEYKSQAVSINNFSIMETAEGARPTNVGGLAEVYLNGSINTRFNYSMSVNGSALGDPILQEDSSVSIDVTLMGKPLSFDLSVALGGMSASLLKVVSSDSNPSYIAVRIHEEMAYRNTATSGSAAAGSFSSYEWEHDADDCQIGGLLRVECAGQSVGEIKLGVVDDEDNVDAWKGDAGDNGSFALNDLVSGKVGIRKPGKFTETLSAAELGDNTTGSIVLDMSNLGSSWEKIDLFGQVRLVADALSAALRKAQSGLNKTFLSDGMRKIPLVGNTIVGAADCLTALDEAFIEPFRKFAYNSQNLDEHVVAERLYAILQRTGLLLALDKKVLLDAQNNCTQKVLWAGAKFDQFFEDNGSQYIQYRNDGNCIEWRFRLGQSYSLSGNADFDLGMPGLGLSSKGGVDLELGWEWYIGFGVSQTGAYIMLSNGSDEGGSETVNGKTVNIVADGISKKVETVVNGTTVKQDLMSGDDICITMRVLANELKINGALGFLQMSADVLPGGTNPFETDAETGKDKLSEITFGIDLNDGQQDSVNAKNDRDTDAAADTKIKADNVASALSLETNLEGSLDIKVDMTLGFNNDKIDIGFPTIGTVFHLTWEAVFGKPFGELKQAEFDNITLNLGDFVSRTLKPILGKVQKIVDPIMPLIDFLQSEIPVLSSLPKGGSKMTVLNLIKSIGGSQGLELGMIDDIVKVANLIKKMNGLSSLGGITLGKLSLDTDDDDTKSFLSGISELPLGDFTSRLSGITDSALKTATSPLSSAFGSQRVAANGNSYGWRFGLFQDASGNISADAIKKSAINLLFGKDVDLVEYRMSPLIFDFDWSKSFPIVGPLCADIGLNFGAKIELCFGYDTRGLISWKNTGFKDWWALVDGFYINDLDSHGKDVSEVIFYSGITAGASVAGRAGINVGVNLNLNLNLDDPNNDGKLRLSELADSLAHSPFAIFDASVTLQARAYAYLDLVFYRKEFDLWKSGALELFNTDKTGTGKPVIATTQEGNLVVNVGTFAEKRVYGVNLSDGNDTVTITCSGNDVTVKIDGIGDATYKLDSGKTVYVYANEGDDHIKVMSKEDATDSSLNFVIEGGNGNDEIDLSGLKLKEGCYALVMGGLGDDFIHGADIGVNILLGETADILYKTKKNSDEEYVALVNAYPSSSNPGNNVIVGGSGKNYIVGGGGSDLIVGGVDATIDVKAPNGTGTDKKNVTENHLYGDFAYFEFGESLDLSNAKNEDLYDEGGNDVILGSSKTDFIFGGAGSDRIKGGDGDDEIHGGKGNDVIYGGAGNDKIYGEDGVDVIFGDTPANDAMVIVREDDAVGELPYVYIAEEIKKDTSDLFGSDTVTTTDADGNVSSESVNRIALFNLENSFKTDVDSLNARAQEAVKLFDAPQVDLSATQTAATTGATATGTTAATEAEGTEPQAEEEPSTQVTNGSDVIEGGNGSDIIFGDDGLNTSDGGSDKIAGGAGNDFIDGDGGNDTINGDYGEDIIYGGLGNDTLDGGAGNDFVFGDNGLAGYVKDNNGAIVGASELFKNSFSDSDDDEIAKANQELMFGYGMTAFAKNFGITADAKSNNIVGNDIILAGNGSDFVDGQGGDDNYKIQIMGGSNHAITNVMDSGTADKGDSMTIDGTVEADDMLVRASTAGLGFVAKLPSKKDAQIERVNFWNVGGGDTGLENIALNTGAGNDKIAIDGTLSTITIDAGAGNDTITVGQEFESERGADSNVKPNDVFKTIKTSQGYLSEGVKHSTSIVGGEGNDVFNVLHNQAAVSLSGGLGNDTFNVAMFQKINDDGSKSIVENGPVTLIGGAGIDKMSIVGSDGDDDFVLSQGRVLANGIDVQSVSIENKNVYGGDGDDSFYVLDTAEDEVMKLYGNNGNDSFYNGGVGTAEKPVIVPSSKNADSDAIGVKFFSADATKYSDPKLDTAKNSVDEGASPKTVYKIALTKQPQEKEVVSVTIFAPGETSENLNRGDHGIWLVDSKGRYCKSITYKFGKSASEGVLAWNSLAEVKLVAIGDDVREGNDYFSLLHNVSSTRVGAKIKDCKNALIFLDEKAAQQSFEIRQVHSVTEAEFDDEEFTLPLSETPNGTVQCFYYANGQEITFDNVDAVQKNGEYQVTVDVPASVKTEMVAANTSNVYLRYNINRQANEVENQFSITQEHVLTAEEITNGEFAWPMRALPENSDIDCWYMLNDNYVNVSTSLFTRYTDAEGVHANVLVIPVTSLGSSITAGTKLYINYRFDHVYVENESVLQMAYSTTGMTELLCFVPKDEITGEYNEAKYSYICPESRVEEFRNNPGVVCRYFYRTAGTQLIICAMPQNGVDTKNAKPVMLHGNFAIDWSEDDWHRPVVGIADEPDAFNETSAEEILDNLDADTIANIKGALYEDGAGREGDLGIDGPSMLHYDPEKPTGNDETNVISESDLAERKAAEEAAAKFDEGNSKDRIFVNNRKNDKAGTHQNELKEMSAFAKWDESLIAKGVDSASILQKKDDVIKQADSEWLDSDKHSLRFNHKESDSTSTSNFNLANMEYGEINLGTGADTVDIHKTIFREDGFQTFTVVNAGSAKKETSTGDMPANATFDDQITIHSYAAERSALMATLTGIAKVVAEDETDDTIAYSVSSMAFKDGYDNSVFGSYSGENAVALGKNLSAKHHVFLNVEYTDGTFQRREIDLTQSSATKIVLKRDLTPVADGVEIKTVTLIENLTGDGMLVVNAQGGDDKIVATNAKDITRDDLVVIGGTGADTIDVATNAIAFGDRGQVIFKNEKGEVVTVLGSQDIDVNENDPAKLTEADYTTPSSKTKKLPDGTDGVNTNYFQTDGVVRDAFTIKSMSDTVGGNDKITTHGDKNVAIGGAGSDKIHLNGENNVAVGDNGEVKYVASDSVVGADGNVVEHVYGDSNKTYLHYVQSTSDEFGDKDTITTGDGKNVVIGGTNADTITTGAGNDVIIGDGGEVYVDRDRNPLFVNNDNRNLPVTEKDEEGNDVVKNSSGGDKILAGDGDNVVFGGLNGDDALDDITTGTGKDVVFGDNAYATFRGNSSMASDRKMENLPTVDAQAILSFNFQGASQTGLNPGDEVGAPEFKTNNWNNISGSIAGTYGNDDAELVRFDNGTRASAVSVSYGGIESHRVTSTDRRINLQAYTLGLHGTSSNKDAKMMNSGLMTTAPNDQCDNQLEVAVDGLAQYFESYDVAVYLDLPDANSWQGQSVRLVSLYINGVRKQAFYVNDPATKNYKGSFENHAVQAILNDDGTIKGVKRMETVNGQMVETVRPIDDEFGQAMLYSNYVVFNVSAADAADRIVIKIEDGYTLDGRNGKDIPGIAGIQVKGTFHKQDVAASTDIDHGGRDDIKTGGGEDIVVGGTGNDSITTFGDERYGLYDSDVVFGDNAKLTFMDRDNDINTATTLTTAESVAITNQKASYDDTIDTGDGNDTVVGGIGHDTINAGATDAAEEVLDDVKVLSINFTREDADETMKIRQATYKIFVPVDDQHQGTVGEDYVLDGAGRKIAIDEHGKKVIETVGETAGVVADNDWHNMYVKNGELHDMEDYSSHYVDGVSVKISTYHKNDHGTWNEYNAGNAAITHENSDELDGDTANSKLYNGYIASQQQYEIKLTLDHIDQFREKNGLAKKAKCDLYVYLGGDNNDTDTYNYLYRISLNNDEVHYLNDWTGHKFDGDYRDATRHPAMALVYGIGVVGDSGVRVELVGNYVVFRDFTGDRASIRILNEYTGGGQSPKNLPVISAVQIVAGEGRANAAIGGDHDKDLVYGDDAKLTFDLDIPFAEDEVLTDYQNRVTEAKSIAIDQAAVTKIMTEDTITTGKDRDVVVGGEGKDTITMGDGDDVAVGGSANLIVEHNNPLGVFTPNTEIALDQHTINLNLHQNYLDNDNANQQSFQTRLEQGYIAGVQEVDNTNDRKNEISLGKGRNLHLDGSTNQSALVVEEQQQSTDPGTDPGTTPGNDQPGNDQPGNDQPGTQQGDTLPTALAHDGNSVTLSFNQPSMVNVHAGQTIRLVAYNWDGINSWHPNLVMRANPSNGPFPVMEFSWQGGGEPQQFPSKPGEEWFFEVNIPDAYNEVDEQGRKCLAVYVTATADTTFMLTLGSSGN